MTKRIKRNIEEFAKKIFDLISDSSEEGHERLISVFEKAKVRYTQLGYRRVRELEFDKAIAGLKEFPDEINSLLLVANFVSTGGWKSNSANTFLFFKLIDITGYERANWETDAYLHEQVVTELKGALLELIIKKVAEYEAGIKEVDEKNRKLEAQRAIKPQNLVNVLLCDSHELAKETQLANPEKITFCLVCNPSESKDNLPQWQLYVYDLEGRANFLPLGDELAFLLAYLKIDQLPSPNADIFDQIKVCCNNLLGENHNLYLFADGETAGKFARKYPEKHSFCLSAVPSRGSDSLKWQFTWYDMYGKPNHLSISNALADLTDTLKKDRIPASDTEMHYKIRQHCSEVVNELLAKIQVLVNPAEDALKGLEGTYVLACLPTVKLHWYNNLGIRQEISLVKYPALNDWLKEQSKLTSAHIPQLKAYLRHLNIRREVDEKKQVFDFLQKKHGITLIAANDLSKIPVFKLIPGVYILVREPLNNTGEWALYLRQKGNVNERINIDNWETFNQILLDNNELMPDDLSIPTKNTLRDTIISSLNLCKNIKRLCVAVNEFLPEQSVNYRAGSFILTKENNIWTLYYINAFQKAIRANLNNRPQIQDLIQDLKGEPASLSQEKLDELDKGLVDFKPSTNLNMNNFSKVTAMLARQHSGASASVPVSSKKDEIPERNKLNMNKFAGIGGIFGTAPTEAKTETESSETNSLDF